jgi:hypothetical protein
MQKKHAGGRPPTYTKECLDLLAVEMVDWFKKRTNWWLKDFATQKGLVWRYLLELSKNHKELSDALELCKQMQESKLVHKSFLPYQGYPAAFALKNVAGWRDRQDVDLNHSGEIKIISSIPRPVLSKAVVDEEGSLTIPEDGNGAH